MLTKYVLKKFWTRFENIYPLWMAPNMVTLLGLVFNIAGSGLVFYYDPDFNKQSPSWVYLFYGFCIFMYQTFDACDGIHARKTGQSGPLGELFDHCCDAINATLSLLMFASVAGLGKGWLLFVSQFAVLTNFYLSTWETYFTHTLFLSQFSGPVEGIIIIILMCCLTAYRGQADLWGFELFTVDLSPLNVVPNTYTITFLDSCIVAGAIILGFNIYSARRNVLTKVTDPNLKRDADRGLVPFFLYYASALILVLLHKQILNVYTTQLVFTIGATLAFMVGRIILAHLTKQSFPYKNFPAYILVSEIVSIDILTKIYHFDYDSIVCLVVYVGLGLTLALYGTFVFEIIYDITDYLDIWALSIKHPKVSMKAE